MNADQDNCSAASSTPVAANTSREYFAQVCISIAIEIRSTLPKSRELSLAVTKLEEASHWIMADHLVREMGKEREAERAASASANPASGLEGPEPKERDNG